MKKSYLTSLIGMLALLSAASCEQPILGTDDGNSGDRTPDNGKIHVTFNVSSSGGFSYDQPSRAAARTKELKEACTRINYAFFKDEVMIEGTPQTSDDDNFGVISADLEAGTYKVLFVAHNGLGNADLDSAEKITFKDNKVTDTFYYYGELDIDGEKDYDITLKRAVAMFRLVVNDNTPDSVSQMKFYYTGGSSTFDATTGYGCVNSRQTEYRDVEEAAHTSSSQYEVYTFPHSDGKNLKVKITALNKSEETVLERVLENIPVAVNQITQYSGNFFGESQGGGRINVLIDDNWSQKDYEY